MDPNANLTEQLFLARRIQTEWDRCNEDGTLPEGQQEKVADMANRLAELVTSLDQWISKGGFLPQRWEGK